MIFHDTLHIPRRGAPHRDRHEKNKDTVAPAAPASLSRQFARGGAFAGLPHSVTHGHTSGHKKRGFFRISFTLMPNKDYLLQHSPSAFSAQQAAVESHFSAQQAAVESHFSVHSVQAAASVVAVAAAASPSAAFLFELPQQLTIATAAITITKEKIFFITLNV